MASGTEYKLRIIVEGKDNASGPLGKAQGALSGMATVAGGIVAAKVLMKVADGLMQMATASIAFVKESVMSAARVEEMAAVIKTLETNQGLAAGTADKMINSIKDLGITTQSAQWVTAQFVRWQLNSADATKLARLAQDAAVISMQDSSDALKGLMHGITTMNTRVLRTYGITLASTVTSQDEYAESLGKTRAELNETEKIQAVLNAVLAQGSQISGAYEAAMDTAGKKMRSMRRHVVELMNSLGEPLLNAFGAVIDIMTNFLKGMRNISEEGGVLRGFFEGIGGVLDELFGFMEDSDFGFDTFGDHIANILVPINEFLARLKTWLVLVRVFGIDSASAALGLERLVGPETAKKLTEGAEKISEIFLKLKEVFGPFIEIVKVQLASIWESVSVLWEAHGATILAVIGLIFSTIVLTISGFITLALGVVDGFLKLLQGDWDGAWEAILLAVGNFLNLILEAVGTNLGEFIETWQNNLDMAKEIVAKFVMEATAKLQAGIIKFVNAGKELIVGLWNGIKSKIAWLKRHFERALEEITRLVEKIFALGSPSKVFYDIGENLMKGMEEGIMAGAKGVNDVMGGTMGGFVGAGSPKMFANTFYISGGDPRAISREIAQTLKLQGLQIK